MVDTPRTAAALITLYADNTTGAIKEQGLRDFVATIVPTVQTLTIGASVTMTTSVLLVNKASGSATAVTLPAAPIVITQIYIIKDAKGDAASNPITVTPTSGTIDGAASIVLNRASQSMSFLFDGTNWSII